MTNSFESLTERAEVRVAVDIGGTFTDVVAVNTRTGVVRADKTLTTPSDHAQGVLSALDLAVNLETAAWFVHGTTVGLNAILSRAGSKTLLIATRGFGDFLHLGRADRTDIWRLDYRRPEPLIGLGEVYEVTERVDADGSVRIPLLAEDLEPILDRIERDGIESVAVCLINAYRNGDHECQVRDLLLERVPSVRVTLSHEVVPEQREFERGSTAVASAYIAAPVERYLQSLVAQATERGFSSPLHVMRSNGGTASATLALENPLSTLLSGPAGGVVGAERLATSIGRGKLIAIDMGGTSLDASIVLDGRTLRQSQLTLEDLPLLLSAVSLTTVGAGGGSIARVEDGGLRVGPDSAGAAPGPVCYCLGGTQPTVTDANLVLGRIGTDSLLNGRMHLDAEGAARAIAGIATELDIDVVTAAEGIVAVADSKMANAVRTLTAERGLDPREFSLLAFGGAGPLHAVGMANELGIDDVIIPQAPGGFCAWGMLHAPVRQDRVVAFAGSTEAISAETLVNHFGQLRRASEAVLVTEGIRKDEIRHVPSADIRYRGQEFVISVEGDFSYTAQAWRQAFDDEYLRLYSHSLPDMGAEFVNLRLSSYSEVPAFDAQASSDQSTAPLPARQVVFGGKSYATEVLHRDQMSAESVLGPLVIQEAGSTVLVPPGWRANVGPLNVLELRRGDHHG